MPGMGSGEEPPMPVDVGEDPSPAESGLEARASRPRGSVKCNKVVRIWLQVWKYNYKTGEIA